MLEDFIALVIRDILLEADTTAVSQSLATNVLGCLFIPEPDTHTAHFANKMRVSRLRLGTCQEVFGCKYWKRAEGVRIHIDITFTCVEVL
jgi:hypothetical protein